MDRFLNEEDLPQYYSLVNRSQRNATQTPLNNHKIDLFIVLDISGSMNLTSNKIMNFGAGLIGLLGTLISLDSITTAQMLTQIFTTRLDEAKRHLILQIRDLANNQRINQIGLITFNQTTRIQVNLTPNIQRVIQQIQNQRAHGATALYDSLSYALHQLRQSPNPRILIMTDGQDNSSRTRQFLWSEEWFQKNGLKSTFFTICEGDTEGNKRLARSLKSKYIAAGTARWFSNSFDDLLIRQGVSNLI